MDKIIIETEKQIIKRIVSSCIRERLLSFQVESNKLRIKLLKSNSFIVAENINLYQLDIVKIKGSIYHESEGVIKGQLSLTNLLELLNRELASVGSVEGYEMFKREILNCCQNAILTTQQIERVNNELAIKLQEPVNNTFISYLTQNLDAHEQIAFFERWCTDGHPLHPCYKTKFGLSECEYKKFCPEFQKDIYLPILAIRRSLMHKEGFSLVGEDYVLWFAENFTEQYNSLVLEMKEYGVMPEEYYPVFVHPWQYENSITKIFHDLIINKQVIFFENITLRSQSTISFRTMISKESKNHPHIKLPVGIQSTSALRTITPASVENGPRLTKIVNDILDKNASINLKLADEIGGLHLIADTQLAKHLSIVFRQNPAMLVESGNIPIVVAALFQNTPKSQMPLLKEIIDHVVAKGNGSISNYFYLYSQRVIDAFFELMLIYGISLEGHQQNAITVFNKDLYPEYIIIRDLGGVTIDLPTLDKLGLHFKPFPSSAIVADEFLELVNTFLHSVIQLHLGSVINLLIDNYGLIEHEMWHIVKNILNDKFNSLKPIADRDNWEVAYHAILENEFWKIKGLTRMRLSNQAADYILININNPLKIQNAS